MTSATQDRPHTAKDLLFGPKDARRALAGQILASEVDGNLARALAKLPKVTREAAVSEAAAVAAGLLDTDLIGMLVAGWRKHHDLTAAARRTLAAAGVVELVQLVTHQVTVNQQPSVNVLVDGRQVATVQLGLSVVFDISVLVAGISSGRLIALHSGHCDITATLSIQGADLLTRQTHLELPGLVSLSPGIRLLPASDYPAAAVHPPAVSLAADRAAEARLVTSPGPAPADHGGTGRGVSPG
jgi:hypothetical protein